MAISKNKQPLLAKFTQGISTGSAEKAQLSDWTIIYYTRNSLSGNFNKEIYGITEDFDLIVVFSSNPITKQIAENTLFLVDEYPTNLNSEGNYIVKRIIKHDNNEIVVGCKKRKGMQYKNLYYNNNGQVYSYQINFDSETMRGYVNKYIQVPFSAGDILWLYEPDSAEDVENRIQLNSITNVGIVDNLLVFNEYSFGEYNGN